MSPWVGLPWNDVRPLLAGAQAGTWCVRLTCPPGNPTGRGILRVVALRETQGSCDVILAYEDYEKAIGSR